MDFLQKFDAIRTKFELILQLELEIINDEMFIKKIDKCIPIEDVEMTGMQKLRDTSKNELYNGEFFAWLMCSFKKSFVIDNDYDIPTVRKVIQSITSLPTTGNYGSIWLPTINAINDLAIIKVNKNAVYYKGVFAGHKTDANIHEFFVGYFLNQLRYIIPNFMYVYALFTCENPINNEVCPVIVGNANLRDYTLLENITGQSYNAFIHTGSMKDIIAVYIQVILAVGYAYEYMDFSHYDLHTGNIMVQTLPEERVIKYVLKRMDGTDAIYFVRTQYLAKIIDYGTSHIAVKINNVEQRSFGNYDIAINNIEATKSNPYHDLFKLTGFMLEHIRARNGLGTAPEFLPYYDILRFFKDHDFDGKADKFGYFAYIMQTTGFNFQSSYDPTKIVNPVTKLQNPTFAFVDFIDYIQGLNSIPVRQDVNSVLLKSTNGIPEFSCKDLPCESVDDLNTIPHKVHRQKRSP
jgi:hypothetical protein